LTDPFRPFIVAPWVWTRLLFHSINGVAGQSSLLDWVMVELAKPGNLLYPILLAAAYWFWSNWRECLIGAGRLAGVVGAADALGTQLKGLVQRPRPCVTLADVHQLLGCGGAFSFPSNHAANTAAAAAFFQVLYPKSGWIGWPLGGGHRHFARLHRGPLPDGCDGWMGGGRIDRGGRGLVAHPLVSIQAGAERPLPPGTVLSRLDFLTRL
jgi:hypothetical protein